MDNFGFIHDKLDITILILFVLRRLPGALEKAGLRPWLHRRVSCNDEGISLGQLMIGGASLDE